MKEITVSVVDAERSIHVKAHEGFADIAIGALSAEPETIDELLAATRRFVEPKVTDFFMSFSQSGVAEFPDTEEHMIIDLPGRVLVNATHSDQFHPLGTITHCDEQNIDYDLLLPYRLPADWLQTKDVATWQVMGDRRRQDRLASVNLDVRSVIYGKLGEFLVREWQLHANQMQDPVNEVHDKWLLTARDDLGGKTPRELLLAKRAFIEGDIEDQLELWTLLKRQPPGLSSKSVAYRFGGFGTHEVILYHELVALLLSECERRLRKPEQVDESIEIRHLEQLQQEWLHRPAGDLYSQSPAAMIARERSRLPSVIPKDKQLLDDDCPICQMMAQDDRPAMWHLDNWLLCRRFATSFCETKEQWQEEYGDWYDEDSMDDDCAIDSLDLTATLPRGNSVWQSSYTNMELIRDLPADEAINMLTFAVAGHLAELGLTLQSCDDMEWMKRLLQDHFAQLHDAIRQQQLWNVNVAVTNFTEQLHAICQMKPDLQAKCDDLESKLDDLADRCQHQFGSGQGAAS